MRAFLEDEWITRPGSSGFEVVIALRDSCLFAICPDCNFVLGWTWVAGSTGFWSCLHGCGRVIDNPYGSSTSSSRPVTMENLKSLTLNQWVAGWLREREDLVQVEVKL